MTISADTSGGAVTLDALQSLTADGKNTVLGVSNISFGLPQREFINSAFYTMALSKGLKAAIINPLSVEMMKAYKSYMALSGQDENCMEYIDFASKVTVNESFNTSAADSQKNTNGLKDAIIKVEKDLSGKDRFLFIINLTKISRINN